MPTFSRKERRLRFNGRNLFSNQRMNAHRRSVSSTVLICYYVP